MGTISLDAIRVSAQLEATLKNLVNSSPALSASIAQGGSITPVTALTNGTTANKADRIWHDPARTLTGATSETIDLFDLASVDIGAGAGKDALGQSGGFAEIVAILVENDATSTGNLTLGGDGTTACWNSWANGDDDAVIGPIKPGGFAFLFQPSDPAFAVADTSNHLLKIASSATLEYSITVLGRSA